MNTCDTYSEELIIDAILRKNFTNVGNEFVDDKVKAIRHYAFNACSTIDRIICPKATYIGRQALSGCRATTVELPWDKITQIDYRGFYGSAATSSNPCKQENLILSSLLVLGDYAFANAGAYTSELKSVTAPLLGVISTASFRYQTSLENADFAVGIPTGSSIFEGCTSLKRVHFGGKVTTIPAKLLYGCSAIESLILDGVEAVPTIPNTNAFTNSGLANGYVYVPRALIAAFEADSKWSAYSFRAIEDYPNI